jgi:hypothetical protein
METSSVQTAAIALHIITFKKKGKKTKLSDVADLSKKSRRIIGSFLSIIILLRKKNLNFFLFKLMQCYIE